jgi:L-arabinokinase
MFTPLDARRFVAALPPELFAAGQPIFMARAPGRLDVMGGISDYSGGLCLEWPLQCALYCAVQRAGDGVVTTQSANAAALCWQTRVRWPVAELSTAAPRLPDDAARKWARYVLGALIVLGAEYPGFQPSGARLFIASDVPPGAGAASSAALEIAVLYALSAAFELPAAGARPNALQIARLAQRLENEVVGAPCGLMDQLTCALGRENRLLRLRCQPDLVEGHLAMPQDVALFGIDSGIKHTVGGEAYGRARCAAFMGRRLLQEQFPQGLRGPDGHDHLANLSTDEWRAVRETIPAKMTGRQFLDEYGDHGDAATRIEFDREYSVRLATEHPIYEADRVARFAALLLAAQANEGARDRLLRAAGELMIQSHFSYDHRCDLGAPETDVLVRLARETGPQRGVLGAKITGGGAGGTVAFLTDQRRGDGAALMEEIAAAYARETGQTPRILSGSSPGAEYSASACCGATTITL